MMRPDLLVEIDLGDPTATPNWIDVTDFVRAVEIRRGRASELDRISTGTSKVTLDNRDRRFDPMFAGEVANLVTNPSFEVDTAGYVAGADASGGIGSIARVTSDSYYGLACLRLTKTSDTGYYYVFTLSTSGVVIGHTYTIRVRYRITDMQGTAGLHISYGSVQDWANAALVPVGRTVGGWQEFVGQYTPVPGTTQIRVLASIGGYGVYGAGQGTVLLDGIQISPDDGLYTDGDQDNCRWSGTPHASTSIRGGPYYGSLLPTRRFRVSGVLDGVTYRRFTGYVENWPMIWPGGLDAIVTLEAVDGLAVIAGKELNGDFVEANTGDRVHAVLDAVGWTTGNSWILGSPTSSILGVTTYLGAGGSRAVDIGLSRVQAATFDRVNALQHLQEVEQVENGRLFVNGAGELVFRNRRATLYGNTNPVATFGDATDGSELPYLDIVIGQDVKNVVNDIKITRKGGETQTASDPTSQGRYFVRTLTREIPISHSSGDVAADDEAQSQAHYWLNRLKDAHTRISSLTLNGAAEPTGELWRQLLLRDLGDRVNTRRRPQGGALIEQVSTIEGVEEQITRDSWGVQYLLAPADTNTYWILGDSEASILGVSTRLAY
jgi:hypothetical protein